mmetsp:Transcript_99194/g.309161  ORF Transcript_99194/g.309161 Transcript_99194/m.309161 type:complete len:600 (-) Transcript_99194:71-1870(-)
MAHGSALKLSWVLVVAALCVLCVPGSAKKFLQFEPLSREDVNQSIADELSGKVNPARRQEIERSLQVVFTSLPKNDRGRLNHQAVRYVLHRFFMQQHGWYVRGLEPNGVAQNPNHATSTLKDWVAAYTQERFEEKAGSKGIDLRDLAALAATLEDLIHKEASLELEEVYKILNFSLTERIPREQADEAIHAYMMIYLTNRNISLSSRDETERKLKIFERKYKGWTEAEAFLQGVEGRHSGLADPEGVQFATTADIVADMGEHFGSFNDGECKDLKSAMRGMASSSGKVGRIKLHDFYNKSLYTHWKFTERTDFLRELGALDESGPQPAVIIPNYLSSFTNCLKATSLYAVCCRNECEDLVGHLEREIAGPTASPERVAELVAGLPSDTVPAPRSLPESLMRRLSQMAATNGGEVHLHGRLFAQWMHHAFPLECPYPHEAGTTSPQTAAEWMQRTGSSAHASEEEMRKVVEDACAANGGRASAAEDEEPELPWTDAEELLMARPSKPAQGGAWRLAYAAVPLLAALGWLVMESLDILPQQKQLLRKVLLLACALAALHALDLLDVALFALLAFAIVLLGAFHHLPARCQLPAAKAKECCV